jgi:hypothetical protein
MISLEKIRRNSEQLANCAAKVEEMLMQLTAPER